MTEKPMMPGPALESTTLESTALESTARDGAALNSKAQDKQNGLVIYGGTFDPVHFGHLRSAIEVGQALGATTVKMVPSFVPPHRQNPTTSAIILPQLS